MTNYYITISNGLLKDEHELRMGPAVWQYMWCIDKLTMIDADGTGWVLGGKPVKLKDFGKNRSEDTISRNLNKLQDEGYLKLVHTPYGIKIGVLKAKKRFGKNAERGTAKMPNPTRKNAEPNKTVVVDNTERQGEREQVAPPSAKEFFESDSLQSVIIRWLVEKGVSEEAATLEVNKFIDYWTEPNKSGSKVRWEGEKFFDLRRRLATWLRRASEYKKSKQKGTTIGIAI